jgi:hypothetical protein
MLSQENVGNFSLKPENLKNPKENGTLEHHLRYSYLVVWIQPVGNHRRSCQQ